MDREARSSSNWRKGTVAVELELDAYGGGMDNDTRDKDVEEENEGD
jgi:hypothetical protein